MPARKEKLFVENGCLYKTKFWMNSKLKRSFNKTPNQSEALIDQMKKLKTIKLGITSNV